MTRQPTPQETKRLTAYRSTLCSKDFKPIRKWHGMKPDEDDVRHIPFPEYEPVIDAFFKLASQEQWCDVNYNPDEAALLLKRENAIEQSTLAEIKTMLTFCVRGERFCDGHWGSMISNGIICRILQRLQALMNTDGDY